MAFQSRQTEESEIIQSHKPQQREHAIFKMKKSSSMAKLYETKPRTSSANPRPRLFSREGKSRNARALPQFMSTFSKNCFKESRSSINFKTARKYETEILNLQDKIQDMKNSTRESNYHLSVVRKEKQQAKEILVQLVDDIRSEMATKINVNKALKKSTSFSKLVPSWNKKYIEEFKNSGIQLKTHRASSGKENKEEDEIGTDELLQMKLIESKERIVRLIMLKSGLFKNDPMVQT